MCFAISASIALVSMSSGSSRIGLTALIGIASQPPSPFVLLQQSHQPLLCQLNGIAHE